MKYGGVDPSPQESCSLRGESQHPMDHQKSKRVPEKHLLLLH